MLKSEKGMSRLELVITIATIMMIAACTIMLSIGEDGLFFLPKNNEIINNESGNVENNVDNTEGDNNTTEDNENNEIIPAENKIANEIENIIDDTVYPGQ